MKLFKPAQRENNIKLRLALAGPAGSGKTYTALTIAKHLSSKIALLDTENNSAALYADKICKFDVANLDNHHPDVFVNYIKAAQEQGYEVCIIDSFSHAWAGNDGALELAEAASRKEKTNKLSAWNEVNPVLKKLHNAIFGSTMHIICTMRTKTDIKVTEDFKVQSFGLKAIMREGIEYEFDIVARMSAQNELVITKTRCEELNNFTEIRPGQKLAGLIKTWLTGEEIADSKTATEFKTTSNKQLIDEYADLYSELYTENEQGAWNKYNLWASGQRTSDVNQLTAVELQRIIKGLRKKIAQKNKAEKKEDEN